MVFRWHSMDFPEYSVKGLDDSPKKLKFIKMPEDLTNWSVLDIGCWDGYFSFVAEKKGGIVTAFDSPKYSWNREGIMINNQFHKQNGKEGFEIAKQKLNSNVKDVEGELDNLKELGQFDLVLDLGILYHVKDPYLHIRDLYQVTKKLLILETHVDLNDAPFPVMRFYPNKEINNDEGTIWGPNMLCVYEMLRKAGFKNIEADYNGRGVFHGEKK